jgi:hypothetical protein
MGTGRVRLNMSVFRHDSDMTHEKLTSAIANDAPTQNLPAWPNGMDQPGLDPSLVSRRSGLKASG